MCILHHVVSLQPLELMSGRATRAQEFGDCMSMVVDGSDNQEYGLPYFCQVDKETCGGLKFKVCYCVGWKQMRSHQLCLQEEKKSINFPN